MEANTIIFCTIIGICVFLIGLIFIRLVCELKKHIKKSQILINQLNKKRKQEQLDGKERQNEQKKIVLSMKKN